MGDVTGFDKRCIERGAATSAATLECGPTIVRAAGPEIRDLVTRVANESAKNQRAELARRVLATGLNLRSRAVVSKARYASNDSSELVISTLLEKGYRLG